MAEYVFKKFDRSATNDIEAIKRWWGAKVGSPLGDAIFSDYGYMLVDEEVGEGVVSVFLYPILGCVTAMIGFPVSNPKFDADKRRRAIHLLTTLVEREAKNLNYRFLISYAGSEGAIEMFTRENYKVWDETVVNFGKVL